MAINKLEVNVSDGDELVSTVNNSVDKLNDMPSAAEIVATSELLHEPTPSLSAAARLYKTVSSKLYTMAASENLTLVDGDIIEIDVSRLTGLAGNEVFSIHAAKTLINTASNISDGDTTVTLAAGTVVVGQYVSVEGDIAHANYTPARQMDAKVCGKVISVSGSNFTLDRTIDYNLTSVSVYAIPNTKVSLKGGINSCSVDLENIAQVQLDCEISGSVATNGVFLDINTSSNVNGGLRIKNAFSLIGAAFNYVSGGRVDIQQESSGSDNVGSKVIRGNAVSNSTFTYVGSSASYKDFGFDGSRNCTFNIKSKHGGRGFFDSGSTAANRLEQAVIAESDNITINSNITDANDQGLEIIEGTNIIINGVIHNSKSTVSSEGALIIKGATDGVTVNADVRGYGSRGIKIECSLEAKNVHVLPTSTVYSDDNAAVAVRDGVADYSAGITLQGRYSGLTPIDIKLHSNDCTVDATIDMSLAAAAGVVVASPVKLLSVVGINTTVNKQLVSVGNTCTNYRFGNVFSDTDDSFITLNGDSRALFGFDRVKNVSCKLVMGGNSTVFFFRNGVPYANSVPNLGVYSAGDFYQRQSSNKPSGSTMELGRKYDGTNWVQLLCSF